ncbi:MAG: pirin family protein [Piscinibacter sp.]|nr:pirin family protein [Piscinibacter sp.]
MAADLKDAAMQKLEPGVELRPGDRRGTFSNHWLHARFSFSFGSWQQPGRDRFGPLRALNEDTVQPGTGFDMHPHRDLDIFMLPLAGAVAHHDSLGHRTIVRPGQVQRMRAGAGIRHSQMNASASELDHHLQIWLTPRQAGGTPTVEARDFDLFGRPGRWCPVITPDGRDGSFVSDPGTFLAAVRVGMAEAATWSPRAGSMVYLHAIDGRGTASIGLAGDRIRLGAGDALAIARATPVPLRVEGDGTAARFLIFEFAAPAAD